MATNCQTSAERQNFLTLIIKQRSVIESISKACMSYLVHNQNSLPKETYEEKMRDLARKQNLLFNGDAALARQQDRILVETEDIIIGSYEKEPSRLKDYVLEYFYSLSTEKIGGRGTNDGQARWTRLVSKHYGLIDHERKRVWSPITKRTEAIEAMRSVHGTFEISCTMCSELEGLSQFLSDHMICTHFFIPTVVPSKIGYRTMGHLFDDGHSLMWSTGNSLPMERPLARSFEELDFCLVPHNPTPREDERMETSSHEREPPTPIHTLFQQNMG